MKKPFFFVFLLLILFIFYACENDKIQPGFSGNAAAGKISALENITTVEKQDVIQMYEAVGTIRPLTESMIESQISAQVIKVSCVPGMLSAQLKQAKEGLAVAKNNLKQTYKSMDEAKAGLDQTKAAYNRTKKLFESDIVTSQNLT